MPDEVKGGRLGYALVAAANAWRAELARALAPAEITPPQFFALAALLHRHGRDRPPPRQRELADATGIDVNTTSQVIRCLEARGVVHRQPHPDDSRAVAIGLTEDGLALARRCAAEARAVNGRFFADADIESLFAALDALTAASKARV
jgi:DNA-binding MarR family transcriptional regulator